MAVATAARKPTVPRMAWSVSKVRLPLLVEGKLVENHSGQSKRELGTAMTLKWIANRLKMGAWTHVSNCLVQKRRQNEKCK